MTDEQLQALIKRIADNDPTLTRADFSDNQIKTRLLDIAKALENNTHLTEISFSNSGIEDQMVPMITEALKINKSLKVIELNGNNIGNFGAQAIAEMLKINNSLMTVGLSYCKIRDSGVEMIAEALKINKSVTLIGLGNELVSNQGAKAILNALEYNCTLTWVAFMKGSIDKRIEERLDLRFERNRIVGLDSLSKYSTLEFIERNDARKSLKIRDRQEAKEMVEVLKTKKSLISIELIGCNMGDQEVLEVVELLKTNQNLTELNLYGKLS